MKNKNKLHSLILVSVTVILFLVLISATASASTLNVGSTAKYKTIQSAVNAAKSGDTIKVASGTYKENVQIAGKKVIIGGTNLPTVNGFSIHATDGPSGFVGGHNTIYGFKIVKNGVGMSEMGVNTIRNDVFVNCGVGIQGQTCSGNTILNNKFTNDGIYLYDTQDNAIIGNYISGAPIGLSIGTDATCKTITKNTFTKCKIGVQLEYIPSYLTGNHYIKNKVNIKIVPAS
jgi:nitrous oxidase accessory protein NosD